MALVLTYNSPSTLERCLKAIDAQEPGPALVRVVDTDLGGVMDTDCEPEAGAVVSMAAAPERAGMEDTEYPPWRMGWAGYEPLGVLEAVVLHHQDRRTGPKAAWKFYYAVRNSVYFRLRVQRDNPTCFYRLARALGGATQGCYRGPSHIERSRLCLRGLLDRLLGCLGPRPDLPPGLGAP